MNALVTIPGVANSLHRQLVYQIRKPKYNKIQPRLITTCNSANFSTFPQSALPFIRERTVLIWATAQR